MQPSHARSRFIYLALALGTIALGLLVHWRGAVLGTTIQDVLGDALYAVMVVWWVSAIAPGAGLSVRAVTSLALCVGVELSQLSHAPVLETARHTTLGQLVLGSGFDVRDLGAYALGVLAAWCVEYAVRRRHRTRQ